MEIQGIIFHNHNKMHWLKNGLIACQGFAPVAKERTPSKKRVLCKACRKLLVKDGHKLTPEINVLSPKERKKQWRREQKKIARQAKKGKLSNINVGGLKKDEVIADGFLQTFQWRQLRYLVLKERGRRCECCGKTPADGREVNVDHIKPRRHYPELALAKENLQILCHECNHGKGNWDDTDWRQLNEAS